MDKGVKCSQFNRELFGHIKQIYVSLLFCIEQKKIHGFSALNTPRWTVENPIFSFDGGEWIDCEPLVQYFPICSRHVAVKTA